MKRILLLFLSIAFSLFLCEMILFANGRYNNLVDTTYSNDMIWGPPEATTTYFMHPDLHFNVPLKYDHSGVRNDGLIETEDKKNVYAFFGDSMTENKRILSEFTFTEILGELIPDAAVVNYGVSGYGLDQEYLRYKRFSHQDIKRVFYVFCDNDFSDLYETHLFDINQNKQLIFLKPESHWTKYIISKFRITYLLVETYTELKSLFNEKQLAKMGNVDYMKDYLAKLFPHYKSKKPFKKTKQYDADFSNFMRKALIRNNYNNSEVAEFRNKFRMLLQHWNDELAMKGIEFDIVVVPTKRAQRAAVNLFGDLPLNVLYLRNHMGNTSYKQYKFKSAIKDNHWNEKGNLFAAITIYKYLCFALSADDDKIIRNIEERIAELYASSNPVTSPIAHDP